MFYELVAYGDVSDLISLENYQNSFNEGDKGHLDLQLASSTPDSVAFITNELNSRLLNNIEGYSLEARPSLIRIHFKVAIAPLVIIALAIAAIVVLLGLLLAWKLYKLTPAGVIGSTALFIFIITLAVVAGITLIMALRKTFT